MNETSAMASETFNRTNNNSKFAHDVFEGLNASPKQIPSVYFYDEKGSRLFEAICDLPEYYPTRTETLILRNHAREIALRFPSNLRIIELGSGSSVKTRILLESFLKKNGTARYIPIDVSGSILFQSARVLKRRYPDLTVQPVAARYEQGVQQSIVHDGAHHLILWLGSSIGNFTREQAVGFLNTIRTLAGPNASFLIGIDLRKERSLLEKAYDDAQGVTAAFNLNLLERMNRELLADFDLNAFKHLARYDEQKGRVEMHLVSRKKQTVYFADSGFTVRFEAGESIHTENSYKYSMEEIEDLAAQTGFILKQQWLDPKLWFSLNLFIPR